MWNFMKVKYGLMAIGMLLMTACGDGEKQEEKIGVADIEAAVAEVDTMMLRRQTFRRQVICNGKLTAIRKSELNVPTQGGLLEKIFVRNGSQVSTGQLLAQTDQRDKLRELERARHDLERAEVELLDKLIGLGYDGTEGVPAEVLKRAEVTSGLYSAKFQLRAAETALDDCLLRAPFSGVVADMSANTRQQGGKFCTLIDNSYFDAEFSIMETELPNVSLGTEVVVSPFINESLSMSGNVTEINPTVDSKGLIKIKARIKNHDRKLVDGMNVRVIVENSIDNVFVVPKEAVLERDGYHVAFICVDGRAVWTYVDVTNANLTQFAITGCARKNTTLEENSVLIVSGNMNLADNTEVRVKG